MKKISSTIFLFQHHFFSKVAVYAVDRVSSTYIFSLFLIYAFIPMSSVISPLIDWSFIFIMASSPFFIPMIQNWGWKTQVSIGKINRMCGMCNTIRDELGNTFLIIEMVWLPNISMNVLLSEVWIKEGSHSELGASFVS